MKPVIPIAAITSASGTDTPGALRFDFADVNGKQGVVLLSLEAVAALKQALKFMDSTSAETAAPTVEVRSSTKAALNDGSGGLGLMLGLAGGTSLLVKIPPAIVPALTMHLRELASFQQPHQAMPKH